MNYLKKLSCFFILSCSAYAAEKSKLVNSFFRSSHVAVQHASKLDLDSDYKVLVDVSYYQGGSGVHEIIRFQKLPKTAEDTEVIEPKSVEFTCLREGLSATYFTKGRSIYVKLTQAPITDPVLDLWINLKPSAGNETAKLSDLTVNNGSFIASLGKSGTKKLSGSPFLQCSQSALDSAIIYHITWDGNDLDGDSIGDRVSFDLIVEGFEKGNPKLENKNASVSDLGTAIGVTHNNLHWGVGKDIDIDLGESVTFRIENLVVDADKFVNNTDLFAGFSIGELDGGKHQVIYGEGVGENLDSVLVNRAEEVASSNLSKLMISSGGSEDDYGFLVKELNLHLKIHHKDEKFERNPSDYTDTSDGIQYRKTYPNQEEGVNFPMFSWDKVPLWLAVRKDTPYTPEELQTIADNYHLVLLEKQNKNGFEFQDDGASQAAADLKRLNSNIKLLTYWNSYIKYGLYSQIGDFDPKWLTEKQVRNKPLYIYDIKNKNFQKWWVDSALTFVNDPNMDGIFIDSLRRHGGYFYNEKGEPTNDTYKMLASLKEKMPKEKMLVGNCLQFHLPNANRHLLECFDGAHTESWDEGSRRRSFGRESYDISDSARASIQYMDEASSKGKLILMQATPIGITPQSWDPIEDVKFPLALYLMIAKPNTYFSMNRGINAELDNVNNENKAILSPSFIREFNRPLGAPKGPYTQSGDTYTREFEHLKVSVNIATQVTTYEWAEDADGDDIDDEQELDEHGSVFHNN